MGGEQEVAEDGGPPKGAATGEGAGSGEGGKGLRATQAWTGEVSKGQGGQGLRATQAWTGEVIMGQGGQGLRDRRLSWSLIKRTFLQL